MTTILVVDDYETNTEILTAILEMGGYKVLTAHDGRPALVMLANHAVDLVITDDRMSNMNGFELANAIHTSETLQHVPVMLISAYQYSQDFPQRMEQAGISAFLPRPHTIEQLLSAVKALVNRPPDV